MDGNEIKSMQLYTAEDFLSSATFVNKNVDLKVVHICGGNRSAVLSKLADFYGADKTVTSVCGETETECALSAVSDCEELVLSAESLTEHKRFDFADLVDIMKRLRAEGGCEWDRAQDHKSIRINLIEEAYELVEAIDCENRDMMLEESGDVLMQSVFHTEIAEEEGDFNFSDMLTALCRKLLDRHTHIFGANHADNAEQALGFWTEAKKKEKKYKDLADAMSRVPKNLPALLYSEKIQKIAKKGGFDWNGVEGPAAKVGEELNELLSALLENRNEEAGDLLFAVVNVLRFYKIDPEMALHEANAKFMRRFKRVEELATADGKQLTDYSLDELDKFWETAKAEE